MEADRLLYVISEVLDDFEQQEIIAKMTAVEQALQHLAQQPTAELEESFRAAVEQLRQALASSSIDELVPSCQRIRDAIGAGQYTGRSLQDQIDTMFNVAPFLAASIQKRFTAVVKKVRELIARLEAGKKAIEDLGIDPYSLPSNEFELGILFPDNVIGSSLDDLLTQLREWNETLRSLAEAIKGRPGTVEIRGASSGSFDLFISIDAEGALVLAMLIGGIQSMFCRLKASKETRKQLEKEGYSADTLAQFDKDVERKEKEELEELTQLVIQKYPKQDDGRKKELLAFLRKRIEFIKQSVRDGVDIEVSVSDEAEPGPSDDQLTEGQLSHATPAMRRALSAATRAIADERDEAEKVRNRLPAPEAVATDGEVAAEPPPSDGKKATKAVKAEA
jgi:hypothetical protein